VAIAEKAYFAPSGQFEAGHGYCDAKMILIVFERVLNVFEQ
jgi:hypothetical protein